MESQYQLYLEKDNQTQIIGYYENKEVARKDMINYVRTSLSPREYHWELNCDDSITVFKKYIPRKITYTEFLLTAFCCVSFHRETESDEDFGDPIEIYRIAQVVAEDI